MSSVNSVKHKSLTIGIMAGVMVIMAMFAVLMPTAYADESDPWTDIPEEEVVDWGEMWGTVIQFQYTYDPEVGNMAQTIEWDFGDGSARSTEWNPQHTYTQHGTYTVVQHVTNSYEGFSEDWGYYRLTIMGKPYVNVITPEGADPVAKIYATKGTAPAEPADAPVFEGHIFVGYYADTEHTVPFDWTVPIDTPVTVYAKFIADGSTPVTPGEDSTDGSSVNLVSVALYALTGIVLLGAIYTRRPILILFSAGLILTLSLNAFDVIDLSKISELTEVFER